MSANLEALRKVAALDAKIFALEAQCKQIPELLQQHTTELETLTAALAQKEVELKDAKVKASVKEKELQAAEQAVIKFRDQINQAKSNKEFQALQHEILSKEADNTRLEDGVLQSMQKVDRHTEEHDALAAERKAAEAALHEERTRLESEAAGYAKEADDLRKERATVAGEVAPDIFAKYERLISRRGQTAMVAVVDGSCQGCYMKLRPETMAQLRKGGDLVFCHSCARILYLQT